MIGSALGFITGGSFTRLAATLLAGVALGGWGAWQVQGWRAGHNQAQQIERLARDTLRQVERGNTASTIYQTEQADAEQVHTRIVERVRVINARPASVVQCLDADGLRELGAAIDNGAPAAAGSGATLPAAGTPR
jgi:hypothetical protein